MSLVTKFLSLPSFLFSVFIFYWSLPIFAIPYRIRFANVGKRNDMLDWAKALVGFFRVTVLKPGATSVYRGGPCLYLCNHRSWADFFIDVYLTQGQSALMSRWLVFFVFPVFCTSCLILRGIVLFKRGTILDKEAFNAWLDATRARSIVPGLVVYPEGHRSLKPTSLPLKRGMIHYAFSRRLPVQLIVTSGKEHVLSEKTMSVKFGKTLVTSYSKPLKPSDYATFDAFMADIQSNWDQCWKEAYTAPARGMPEVSMAGAHSYAYPRLTWCLQLAITVVSIVILGGVLAGSWRGAAAVLAAAGPVGQQVLVSLLALWAGVSLLRSFLG